jgi:hypothetical protein
MHCKLPVSGKAISLLLPSGWEDVLLCEWRGEGSAMAHRLLGSITAKDAGQETFDWGDLPITDIEWALLLLRRSLFGDFVTTSVVCKQPECGAKIDVSFRIRDYLGQFQLDMPTGVEKAQEPGWFSLTEMGIKFRLPTGNDRHAVAHSSQPALELKRLCVLAEGIPEEWQERVEESLEAMAPVISGILSGECPECGLAGEFYFDVQSYVLQELIDQAKFVFEDVHLIASRYQWSEDAILNLPRQRRYRYVESIIRDRSVD